MNPSEPPLPINSNSDSESHIDTHINTTQDSEAHIEQESHVENIVKPISPVAPAPMALPAFKDMTPAQKRQLIAVMSGMIAKVLWKSLKPFIIMGILSGIIYYSYERFASSHRDNNTISQQSQHNQGEDVPK